jgi:SAM-dependent methyltransferase
VGEWSRYYDATSDEPRETLLQALDAFDEPGLAVDLGCGTGRDTGELVRRGWHVVAIDAEDEALERLRVRLGDDERVTTQRASYENARIPVCDLVNAGYALPFCPPEHFPEVWNRIVASLRPGGRFCGQLFGDRDDWATPELSFQTRAEAEALLAQFELERFDEEDEDGTTALGEAKHWHVFHVVARKR